jgi:flagellin
MELFASVDSYTIGGSVGEIVSADMNRDGILDLLTADRTDGVVSLLYGKENGSFENRIIVSAGSGSDPFSIAVADFSGDGLMDILASDNAASGYHVMIQNENGTFAAATSVGLDIRKSERVITADFNSDGIADIALGNGIDATGGAVQILLGNTRYTSDMEFLNLSSQESANEALETVNAAITRVTAELGAIGSMQSRFSHTITHLQVMRENYAAANSKIVDADIAEEVAQMVRQQILQQAITAVMAQANQQPALVLQLLK